MVMAQRCPPGFVEPDFFGMFACASFSEEATMSLISQRPPLCSKV
jgi:hypothetical protein